MLKELDVKDHSWSVVNVIYQLKSFDVTKALGKVAYVTCNVGLQMGAGRVALLSRVGKGRDLDGDLTIVAVQEGVWQTSQCEGSRGTESADAKLHGSNAESRRTTSGRVWGKASALPDEIPSFQGVTDIKKVDKHLGIPRGAPDRDE